MILLLVSFSLIRIEIIQERIKKRLSNIEKILRDKKTL
jgi:hypothetical protein